jgi:hypothetical protein
MNVAARVCRSPDSWLWTDHPQIRLSHSPTPPKCSMRAIVALINNLGIVYHQYCSSSPPNRQACSVENIPGRIARIILCNRHIVSSLPSVAWGRCPIRCVRGRTTPNALVGFPVGHIVIAGAPVKIIMLTTNTRWN